MNENNNNPYEYGQKSSQQIYDVSFKDITHTNIDTSKQPRKKKNRRFLKVITFILIFAFSGGIFFGAGYGAAVYFDDALYSRIVPNSSQSIAREENDKVVIEEVQPIANINEDITSAPVIIAQEVGPSVVTVTSTVEQPSFSPFQNFYAEGSGSGIIFGIEDERLLIVTNYHVIEGAAEINIITSNEDKFPVKVLGYDSSLDIAVIAVDIDLIDQDVLDNIAIATFGDSDDLQVGELAVAIGSPLGEEFSNSVTVGVISAIDRIIGIEGISHSLIQTDAAINPGNSGGALVNGKGEIIGINSAKYIDTDVEGMGFAIPINIVQPIIEDILNGKVGRDVANQLPEDRSYLGIGIQNITSEIYAKTGVPFGVYITEVYENSGADAAGIRRGDIIFSVENKKVLNIEELTIAISNHEAGDIITVGLIRNDEIIEVEAKLSTYNEIMD